MADYGRHYEFPPYWIFLWVKTDNLFRLVHVKNLCNMPIIAMYSVLFLCILHKTDFGSDFVGSNFQRVYYVHT